MASEDDCPVCQMKMILPTVVPVCGHKYCFICIKGVANNPLGLCPMCRGPIDRSIFNCPKSADVQLDMKDPETEDQKVKIEPGEKPVTYFWLYEGRNGWWRFDPRSERDVENGKVCNMPLVEVNIMGEVYIVDYQAMLQYPKQTGICRRRKLKRVEKEEMEAMNVRGIAGVSSR